MEEGDQAAACVRIFDWMDTDKLGKVTFREFKSTIIRAFHKKLPDGLLVPLQEEEEVKA